MKTSERPLPPLLPWLIWGLGSIVFAYGFFQRVAPGVMVVDLMRDFSVGGAVVGNLSAIYFYTYAVTQVPAGLIVDAYGSRRILIVSATLLTVGSLIFAGSESVLQAFAGRLLIGLGAGATFVIALNLAAVWLPRERFMLASGLVFSFGVLGSLAGQLPLAWGVEAAGWRASMHVSTLVVLVACVATWFTLRAPRPKPRNSKAPDLIRSLRSVLRRSDTWVLTAAGAGTMSIMLVFAGLWGLPWLTQVYGFTRPEAAAILSINAVGWGVGAPVLGWLSEQLGSRKLPYLGATLLSLICFATLVLTPDLPHQAVYALLVLQGAGTGAIVLVFTAAHDQFAGGQEGASAGIINTGIMIGAALLQSVIGWLLDMNWHGAELDGGRVYDAGAYQLGLSVLVASGALAVTAGLFIRESDRPDP